MHFAADLRGCARILRRRGRRKKKKAKKSGAACEVISARRIRQSFQKIRVHPRQSAAALFVRGAKKEGPIGFAGADRALEP